MKKVLREKVLKTRKRDKVKDELVFKNLLSLIKDFKKFAIYSSIKEEPLLDPFWEELEKEIYLPIFKEKGFARFKGRENLILSKYNILEPSGKIVDINMLEAIIIPCLAVDMKGARLGYGSGFYDQVLKDYQGLKIGVAYSEFYVEDNFKEAHDIPLNFLVTEKGIIEFGKKNV